MRKFKGNWQDQRVDFEYWAKNWGSILGFVASGPIKVVSGLFKYPWIYDWLKANELVQRHNEGRTGTALLLNNMTFHEVIKTLIRMLSGALFEPKSTVITNILIPSEIYQAMDLNYFAVELPGTVGPMLDQHCCDRYMDLAESHGLPGDTCSYPRIAEGVGMAGHIPLGSCLVTVNLACDGATASYNAFEKKYALPTFHLVVPYNFGSEESVDVFVQDMRGMIAFLEKETGHDMNWDKLKTICEGYNRMQEIETERWEMCRSDHPPIANDNIWLPHFAYYNLDPGRDNAVHLYEQMDKVVQHAYYQEQPPMNNMKYRAVLWNPPTFAYSHFWNWLERCWGIGVLMDLETFGYDEYMDTSSEDSMLKSIGQTWMCNTMSRQMRGPSDNFIGDFVKMPQMFNADFIIIANHIGCRNSMGMSGIMAEEARKRNIPLCVFNYELMDSRVCSRQVIRDQISNFMRSILHAEPLDESLLVIDDDKSW